MAYCNNCGNQLDENAKFCGVCGTKTEQFANSAAPVFTAEPAPARASGVLNVKALVWSIINLLACCMPLGVASLILTILAKDAPTVEEEAKKLKTAKTLNLVGTIGAVVFYFAYVVLIVLITMMESGF